MSNNVTDDTKKLAVRAEMLRHLETATAQKAQNVSSSDFKAMSLAMDIAAMEATALDPDPLIPQLWGEILEL